MMVDVVSLLLNGDDAAAFKLVDLDGDEGTGRPFMGSPSRRLPTSRGRRTRTRTTLTSVKVVARDDSGNRSETDVTVERHERERARNDNAVVDTACGWDPIDGHRHRS